MTTIRVVTCEPSKFPEEVHFNISVETWMNFLLGTTDSSDQSNTKKYGWFEVFQVGKNILLYCLENPSGQLFNRMVDDRPIFGNFIITKTNSNGRKINLSDEEINQLIIELSTSQANTTN